MHGLLTDSIRDLKLVDVKDVDNSPRVFCERCVSGMSVYYKASLAEPSGSREKSDMEDSAQLQDSWLSLLHGETNGKAPHLVACVPYHGQPRADSMMIQEATGFLRSSGICSQTWRQLRAVGTGN